MYYRDVFRPTRIFVSRLTQLSTRHIPHWFVKTVSALANSLRFSVHVSTHSIASGMIVLNDAAEDHNINHKLMSVSFSSPASNWVSLALLASRISIPHNAHGILHPAYRIPQPTFPDRVGFFVQSLSWELGKGSWLQLW